MQQPKQWGTDQLSVFIDTARNNVFASYEHFNPLYRKLVDVEIAFRTIGENLLNPLDMSAPFFVLKAHSSFLGSAHLALAGQVPEAFMLMRGCLEAALYGLHVHKNKKAAEIWLHREDGPKEKQACRKDFTAGNVLKSLKATDSAVYEKANTAYEKTIDFGAHPNLASMVMMLNVSVDPDKNAAQFKLKYLSNESEAIHGAVKSAAGVGVCALMVLRHVFPERFDLLGISEKMPALQSGL